MAACERLADLPEFADARVVMLYVPMSDEIDLTPLATRCWRDGKTVTAPRCVWDARSMKPIEIRSMDDGLETTRGDLREPADGPGVAVGELDLVIVPAVGFDRSGQRLGRGAGFYDRFLGSRDFTGVSVGIAFHEQIVDTLPTTPNDVPVHVLVTDEEVLRFGPPSGRQTGSHT